MYVAWLLVRESRLTTDFFSALIMFQNQSLTYSLKCVFFLFSGGISSSEVVEMCVFLIAAPIDFNTAQKYGTKARFRDKITFTPFLGSLTAPSLKFKGFREVSCVFLCLSLLSLPLLNFYGRIVKRFSTIKVTDFDGSWFEDSAKGKQARCKGGTSPGKMQKYLLM